MAELSAESNIRAGRVDLAFSRTGEGTRPQLRLVRRRFGRPESVDDGLVLLDLDDLFDPADPANPSKQPWYRIERTRYLLPNALTEGGLVQGELRYYYRESGGNPPYELGQIVVVIQRPDVAPDIYVFSNISNVSTSTSSSPDFASITTITIEEGGSLKGTVNIYEQSTDGVTPNRIECKIIPQLNFNGADFDLTDLEITTGVVDSDLPLTVSFVTTTPDEQLRQAITFSEGLNADTGLTTWTLTVEDQTPSQHESASPTIGLLPATTYYYAIYTEDPVTLVWKTDETNEASVMATGSHGMADRMYELLPSIHRYYDDPDGQLRRFVGLFGAAMDQARSLGEGLLLRHDVHNVEAEDLPYLGRWIGWNTDTTLPTRLQRRSILLAREVYDTVGTVPNIVALIRRETGWNVELKEFFSNVFLTNDTTTISRWDIWQGEDNGAGLSNVAQLTGGALPTPRFEGRPALALDSNLGLWAFWHSDESGRRELWTCWPDIGGVPERVLNGAADDTTNPQIIDESPAVVCKGTELWLFWSSNRSGTWDIWARSYSSIAGSTRVLSAPERLSTHTAEDRAPAAVVDASGNIHLFFESKRRGPWDIWMMSRDASTGAWSQPQRVTDGSALHDQAPAAIMDQSVIRLFWSRDTGDQSRIYSSTFDGAGWGTAIARSSETDDGPLDRHGSPAVVAVQGQLRLLWHSNRGGRWRIWYKNFDGGSWGALQQLRSPVSADKEPAAVVDSSSLLRVFWKSQELGVQFRSHTFDPSVDLVANMGDSDDWFRYTYDPDAENSRYRRERVGIYINEIWSEANVETIKRLKRFVEPFRPVTTKFVWFLQTPPDGSAGWTAV